MCTTGGAHEAKELGERQRLVLGVFCQLLAYLFGNCVKSRKKEHIGEEWPGSLRERGRGWEKKEESEVIEKRITYAKQECCRIAIRRVEPVAWVSLQRSDCGRRRKSHGECGEP